MYVLLGISVRFNTFSYSITDWGCGSVYGNNIWNMQVLFSVVSINYFIFTRVSFIKENTTSMAPQPVVHWQVLQYTQFLTEILTDALIFLLKRQYMPLVLGKLLKWKAPVISCQNLCYVEIQMMNYGFV